LSVLYFVASPAESRKLQRETTFRIGGYLLIALGIALGYGLIAAGVGFDFFDAWLSVGFCIGFGGFFLYVARDEGRTRRQYLQSVEATGNPPESPGPR
jgi:hypothetical protein